MKSISLSNQKGGVGKTTTVHNLGIILAKQGVRVLMVDIDPQASLTNLVGLHDQNGDSIGEVLGGAQPGAKKLQDIIVQIRDNLDIAPSDLSLASYEMGLTQRMGREMVLKKALSSVSDQYDVCLIDCGPSLGLLTINGLVAADEIIVPCLPSLLDLRGVSLFMQSWESVKESLNPDLKVMGLLITQYDNRLKLHRESIETIRDAGLPILPVMIGRSVKVAEASGNEQSIVEFAPRNKQAERYRKLAGYVSKWLTENM